MAEDLEVGVLLEPKNNLEEDVGPISVGQEGGDGGGGLSASQKQEQESVISSGFTEALAAAGVLGIIASQLKSITGIIGAVLGAISRALVPVVEKVADFIRPFVEGVNKFLENPGQVSQAFEKFQEDRTNVPIEGPENVQGTEKGQKTFQGGETIQTEEGTKRVKTPGQQFEKLPGIFVDAATDFLGLGGPKSADTTGEAQKQSFKQTLEDSKRDKTGASK